jgi:hypothetical protein
MMKVFRNIGVILLVSLMLATTGGFSIYHHICNRFGNSSSIFVKASCEHELAKAKSSCCKMDKMPTCCAENPVPVSKNNYHKDKCCENTSQFLKISDSFQPGIGKVTVKPFIVVSAILPFDFSAEENTIPSLNFYSGDLPPPDSGKQKILFLHQLKLDPFLV